MAAFGAAEGGEDADGDELALPGVEVGSRVGVAVGELDDVATEIGGDVGQGIDHRETLITVDLPKLGRTPLVPVIGCRSLVGLGEYRRRRCTGVHGHLPGSATLDMLNRNQTFRFVT